MNSEYDYTVRTELEINNQIPSEQTWQDLQGNFAGETQYANDITLRAVPPPPPIDQNNAAYLGEGAGILLFLSIIYVVIKRYFKK